MMIVFSMIGFSLFQIKKRPIVAFAILFFFLNHIVESSFIGLEMIFEHRNYLPSFFLFLPLACLLNYFCLTHQKRKVGFYALIVILVSFFSVSTHIRNRAWKDDVTLWTDAIEKAPNNSRASHNLANILVWGENSNHPKRFDMALKLYKNALKDNLPRKNVEAQIYGNMALVYFHHKDNAQKAYQYFDKALKSDPDNLTIRRNYAEALVLDRSFEEALSQVEILLEKNSDNGRYHSLKGHILLWQKKYEAALDCFSTAYPLIADKSGLLLNSAVALSLAGHYSNAEKVLLEAIKSFPAMMPLYFAIIENSVRSNAEDQAALYKQKLMAIYTLQEINQGLEALTDNPKFAPLNADPVRTAIKNGKAEIPDVN
jgi:tetratricopeptide (TPR) repeat protein